MNDTTKKLLVNSTRTLNLYRLGNSRRTCDFRLPPGSVGNSVPTFRDSLSFSSSRVKKSKIA